MKVRHIKRRVNASILTMAQARYPRIMLVRHKGYTGPAQVIRLTVFVQLSMLASQKRAAREAFLNLKGMGFVNQRQLRRG